MKRILFIAQLGIALVVCCCQCHKAPEPIKPDPCANKTASGADFYVYETFNLKEEGWVDYDTDTAITGVVYFQAKDKKADSYRWEVGAGVYTTSGFSINFYDELNTLNIPIKLIVTKKGDTTCFKDQKGIYTKTRNITIIHPTLDVYAFKDGYYFGTYKGSDGLSDTITMYLDLYADRNPVARWGSGWQECSSIFVRGVKYVSTNSFGFRQAILNDQVYNSGKYDISVWNSFGPTHFTYFNNILIATESAYRVSDNVIFTRTFTGIYLTNQPQ